MVASTLSGLNKAAVLLICLGERASAKIFEELSDSEIRLVTKQMSNIEHVPMDLRKEVVESYLESEEQFAGLFVKGSEFAQKAISNISGKDRVEILLDQFLSGIETKSLETIGSMPATMVAGLLEKEHPQTIALVLSTQLNEHGALILAALPEKTRSDVIYRIATIEKVSPEVISRIDDALHREIGLVAGKEQRKVGGVDKVVDLLDNMHGSMGSDILEDVEETDPEMAEEIRKRMFTFEDLAELDNRSLQMVLREVNNDSLTLALKTASDELRQKIFGNISQRAADMIKDDLDAMGPVRLSEVELTQQSIVKIAMKLEEEGKLVLGTGGGDEFV
ncbi:flagellar motor switch protein FliG [Desulfopila sp. IMCC35008]|uniref:flagellar motor switch protein FliG n=1 Tax=Desulfopila sp. IMCC35008 TaxID=2653858 RepID=UPI0013CFCC88|nr:flagellar motor switch protein FliG [Desulfopila sp. IMCC35008]